MAEELSTDYCNGCEKKCEYGSIYFGCGVGYVPALNGKKITQYTVNGVTKYVGHIDTANHATQIAIHLAALCDKRKRTR